MRRLIAGLMATALLMPGVASAACLKTYEGTALNVAGLKSQLMVTALSCDTRDRYNTFILAFRPTLMSEDNALNSYFSHHYRHNWRSEHDAYITQLANVQSEAGIKQGTLFCQQNVGLFDQVAKFRTGTQMAEFANNAPLILPFPVEICGFHRVPVAAPVIQTVADQTGKPVAAGGTAAAPPAAPATGKKGNFFGNIAHGIGSIF
ncbi:MULTISPECIES: hypothetical protein [unclassified Acidisoma]|jgi:hypothetical protein|uniref:hypothetical protein n=1 Tax=unclassified Acidisoma TaxID=2634065 RepID=UPI00131E2BB6|nr:MULTISPECIES: hypothetical protein [unclassified Acidisoma]